MMEPLKERELEDGYVYIYEVEGNEGFVKIGFTTKAIQDRLAQWEFECDRVPRLLYPLGFAEKIPYANRVEGLCLAELKYRNMIVICGACPKRHIEWIQIPAAEAITVIQKWTKWIHTAPFKDSKKQLSDWEPDNEITSWILKNEEAERTDDMLAFMHKIAAASLPSQKLRKDTLGVVSAESQRSGKEISAPVPIGDRKPKRNAVISGS